MIKSTLFPAILSLLALNVSAQQFIMIDGDTIHLRDSLQGKVTLLSSIERGEQNKKALWITYNRRPGVDPWNKDIQGLEDNFTQYWTENGVKILGSLVTYDDCLCAKHKTSSSPDMFLIHFKVSADDWSKMKEQYPGISQIIKTR